MFPGLVRWSSAVAIVSSFVALAPAFQTGLSGPADAKAALYTARYPLAIQLYREELERNPAWSDGYYGLVRALLHAHRAQEAYQAAEDALRNCPNTAGVETAAGLTTFRHGDLEESERHFRAALKLDPKYPGALAGLASIYSTLSKFRTARDLRLEAYRAAPADPELMLVHANTLDGPEHLAALKRLLAIYDGDSEEAHNVRVHIGTDRALAGRKVRRLVSPNRPEQIKLIWLYSAPRRVRGAGIRVQLNRKETVTLLLDTGASGISLSPKAAEKAGLELLDVEYSKVKGIGDDAPGELQHYVASEVRAGDVVFADYPVAVFRSARSPEYDGLIGADVFQRFLLTIDFPDLVMQLEPRRGLEEPDGPVDAGDNPPEGFTHAIRAAGSHLTTYTSVNGKKSRLFLIDSGASSNLLDTKYARESTSVYSSGRSVSGVQGRVRNTGVADHATLVFAGFRQDNSAVLSFDFDNLSESNGLALSGILGIPILRQLKLSIDYREGSVRFEKGK
jgi:predicted aspartyl protease